MTNEQPIPTQPIPTEKLELEKDFKNPLLVYIFVITPPEIQLTNAQGILIMAYDLETAMIRAGLEAKKVPELKDWKVFYTGQKVPITNFISKLHLDNAILPKPSEAQTIEIPQKEMSKQNFIYGLVLANETGIENKEDKEKIKEILKRIKVAEK